MIDKMTWAYIAVWDRVIMMVAIINHHRLLIVSAHIGAGTF